MFSVKTNIPFDALGLYNIAVKAGYYFRDFMDLRIGAGYTGYYLNEKQALTAIANIFLKDSGITINSLDLNIKAQKIYFALMLPVYGFNVHTNYALYYLGSDTSYSKATLGLEKTFFSNKLSVFANGGMFFGLPASNSSSSIYYNSLVTNYYADGGLRLYIGDHFNIDAGIIYPGIQMYLGDDPDTGKANNLNIPVFPAFNISYRFQGGK